MPYASLGKGNSASSMPSPGLAPETGIPTSRVTDHFSPRGTLRSRFATSGDPRSLYNSHATKSPSNSPTFSA